MEERLSNLNNEEVNQSLDKFVKVQVPLSEVPKSFRIGSRFLDSLCKSSVVSVQFVDNNTKLTHFIHIQKDGSIIEVYPHSHDMYSIYNHIDDQYYYWRKSILKHFETYGTPDQVKQIKALPTPLAVVKETN